MAGAEGPRPERSGSAGCADGDERLRRWIDASGGCTDRVRAHADPGAGRGLVLDACGAAPGDELLFVPATCFLHAGAGLGTPLGQAAALDPAFSRLEKPDHVLVAIALIYARAGDLRFGGGAAAAQAAAWSAYAASLPTPEESWSFPSTWGGAAASLLEGTSLHGMALRERRRVEAEHALLQRCGGAALARLGGLPRYAWARCMVTSRAFFNPEARARRSVDWARLRAEALCAAAGGGGGSGGGLREDYGIFLAPLADLANHDFSAPAAAWDVCARRGGLTLEARRRCSGGRLTISYGRKAVQDLVLHYGFAPRAALLSSGAFPDCAALEMALPVPRPLRPFAELLADAAAAARAQSMLDASGATLRCGIGGASRPGLDRLLAALRLAALRDGDGDGDGDGAAALSPPLLAAPVGAANERRALEAGARAAGERRAALRRGRGGGAAAPPGLEGHAELARRVRAVEEDLAGRLAAFFALFGAVLKGGGGAAEAEAEAALLAPPHGRHALSAAMDYARRAARALDGAPEAERLRAFRERHGAAEGRGPAVDDVALFADIEDACDGAGV